MLYNTSVGDCKWLLNGSGRVAPWSQPLKCLDKTHKHTHTDNSNRKKKGKKKKEKEKEENIWMSRCGQPLSTRPGVWMKWNETTLISISHCRRRHLLSIRNAHLVCLLSFPTYRIISAGSTFSTHVTRTMTANNNKKVIEANYRTGGVGCL